MTAPMKCMFCLHVPLPLLEAGAALADRPANRDGDNADAVDADADDKDLMMQVDVRTDHGERAGREASA